VVWIVFVRDKPSEAGWMSPGAAKLLEERLAQEQLSVPAVGAVREALLRPDVLLLAAQYFLWSLGVYGFVLWLPTILRQGGSLSIANTGLFSVCPYVFAVIMMLIVSQVSDKTLRRQSLIWPLLLASALALFGPFLFAQRSFAIAFACLIVGGGCMYAPYGPFFAIVPERVPRNVVAEVIAFINSSGALGATPAGQLEVGSILAPVVSQEVWAAGVTYFRSRSARIEESKDAGGGDFYDRVYSAERPELFFKATGRRVVGPKAAVRVRSDSKWSVPEPELTLLINPKGKIVGYTIGNDMSSRDIEGENPLYLPQAKVYDGSCAIGPCILLSTEPLDKSTSIRLEIKWSGEMVFAGSTTLADLKRDPSQLADYLFRDNSFPDGAFLMTGR
jgi:2-dehydro-3-deoxy-D-arabinonate dehydratase